jgi:hypothetical protein
MDTQEMLAKLFELQKLNSGKAELVLQLAELYARKLDRDRGRDLNLHRRDEHQRHYDDSIYMEFWREDETKGSELHAEYNEVCEQIKTLEAILETELPVPSGT